MIKLDYNNMMTGALAAYRPGEGIEPTEFDKLSEKLAAAHAAMIKKREEGGMDWRDLPYNQAEVVKDIQKYARSKKSCHALVVLGIGGSALGPMAVHQAINSPYYNELPRKSRNGWPKLYIADNVDPERLSYLFEAIPAEKCVYNVISKSGSTSETMSQFMIIKKMLEDKIGKEETRKRIVCTTDAVSGNLIKIAKEEGYKTFVIPSGVGGRFSQLTPVGLLPAAFSGMDIEAMLKGAKAMDEACKNPEIRKNPAYMFALLNYLSMKKGKNIVVMMPYADSLKYFSDWFAQLWAESLGKKYDLKGKEVFAGSTPVKSLGVTDQHSQVQLYAEGPFDKIVAFIGVEEYRRTVKIPELYKDMPSLGFLGGVTHNRLIEVEREATEFALQKAGRMNFTLTLSKVDEFSVGELIYLFEVATAFAGELLCVNAFDQPGVEEGKNAAYAVFGRPGYEEKKKELDSRPEKKAEYII